MKCIGIMHRSNLLLQNIETLIKRQGLKAGVDILGGSGIGLRKERRDDGEEGVAREEHRSCWSAQRCRGRVDSAGSERQGVAIWASPGQAVLAGAQAGTGKRARRGARARGRGGQGKRRLGQQRQNHARASARQTGAISRTSRGYRARAGRQGQWRARQRPGRHAAERRQGRGAEQGAESPSGVSSFSGRVHQDPLWPCPFMEYASKYDEPMKIA